MTIASEITRLQGAKSCICTAIVNKGVSVSSSVKLDSYYSCINAIPTAVYLTQAEYDALPSSKLTDGIPYGIMVSGKVSKFIRNGTEYVVIPEFEYIIVGGGGGGGKRDSYNGTGGGGGGGEVLTGTCVGSVGNSISVTIGQGGPANCTGGDAGGGNTTFGSLTARGGCGGNCSNCSGGNSGNGNAGSAYCRVNGNCYARGGGGGAGGASVRPNGGAGICGYGGGGGGEGMWNVQTLGCDGGGNGGKTSAGCPATNYGGGGGGGWCASGAGCQGVVVICYKTGGGINCATGGTKTTSGDYTVHTFTSNGTFTIVS